jgi:hypothetical protein
MFRKLLQLLSKENTLSALLAVLIVQLFTSALATLGGMVIGLTADLAFLLILLAALHAIARSWFTRVLFSFLTVLSIITHTAWVGFGARPLAGWDFIFTTLAVLGMLMVTLSGVYRDGPVTSHRIRGAIAAYLLIAVLYAKTYALIHYFFPDAFVTAARVGRSIPEVTRDFLYFSVVTLTTVGFGDITAVLPIARSLAMTEAFIGQLYPAILLARLVSLSLMTRTEE